MVGGAHTNPREEHKIIERHTQQQHMFSSGFSRWLATSCDQRSGAAVADLLFTNTGVLPFTLNRTRPSLPGTVALTGAVVTLIGVSITNYVWIFDPFFSVDYDHRFGEGP